MKKKYSKASKDLEKVDERKKKYSKALKDLKKISKRIGKRKTKIKKLKVKKVNIWKLIKAHSQKSSNKRGKSESNYKEKKGDKITTMKWLNKY